VPELPEVETVRRSLAAMIGRRIVAARLFRADMCTTASGRRARPADLLAGEVVRELMRRGKQLAIIAQSGRVLVVHLGMSGQLRLLKPGSKAQKTNHIHAVWSLDDGSRLTFRDPRRFGGLWTLESRAALEERWSGLGPDALTMSPRDLAVAAAGSRRVIKALLLDQTALAGVGNIYADEALFAAGVRPSRRADRVKPEECERLTRAIRRVLALAVEARGSTLRDYVAADGRAGQAQLRHAVYGRGGFACVNCGTVLRSVSLAQRTTVFCIRCQR
jgi:formamidopyrimidine-DNA glycosylase